MDSTEKVVEWDRLEYHTDNDTIMIGVLGRYEDDKWLSDESVKTTSTRGVMLGGEVALFEAKTYLCLTEPASKNPAFSNLVILDSISDPVMVPSTPQPLGAKMKITCTLVYNAPSSDPRYKYALSPAQDPVISVYVAGKSVPIAHEDIHIELSDPPGESISKTAMASYAHEVSEGNHTQSVQCMATSAASGKTVSLESAEVPLYYQPDAIQVNVTADGDLFNIDFGEVINCSANGYDLPTVQWTDLASNTIHQEENDLPADLNVTNKGPGWALLTIVKKGVHVWNCSASNVADSMVEMSVTMKFSVGSFQSSGSPPQSAENVPLIIFTTLFCMLMGITVHDKTKQS